ncbi:proton-translocating NADH-quinone oxidoreductase, chain L [Solidesulfovibrio fructosivorans JJ]]|uniref:Proton-translocating NADH-quinone oxidoreductase, chain L n=1 Tax=Solidesulfovibrio fructosivorans JJ] TaxID=596151 RepID=E1JZU5_SOLFR|nr:NADH-quinone oxidoreductase subunit L [Solidesulfovibrio fructosivorans]EFL50125.1 proton-translocating NADH-quinone oxidoreductase, chain L [Solidesulfovibrio fructosivorans JJ]]
MAELLALMLLFPLAGALFQAGWGAKCGRRASNVAAAVAIAGALAMAVVAIWGLGVAPHRIRYGSWFAFDGFSSDFSLLYDRVAGVMTVTVTFVALLIHLYSATYMREDKSFARYFCYLNLFVFFMLVIALADDLIFLFMGWEGVGFCSFALIGFWHEELPNVDAGRKAFIMTRIGDLGYVAALGIVIALFGHASLSDLAARAETLSPGMAEVIGFCFLFAALGKSAQLPLSAWLPDAMAGPTPVSALIHAATMVTAGVYLLMRLDPMLAFAPDVGAAAAFIGAATALYGAICALGQRDVKRILAYSTISQVGYMFLAAGCGDVTGALFHLQSHAFFKSLLFMCSGVMIQAFHEEHDIFRMGARLRKKMPGLFLLFTCGAAALAALPLTSGYFSKGRTLADALAHPNDIFLLSFVLGTVAALLTAIYVFRMYFVAFFADPADPAPMSDDPALFRMERPLWPLGVLALVYGFINLPEFFHLKPLLDSYLAGTVAPNPPEVENAEVVVMILDAVIAIGGLLIAWAIYRPARRHKAAPDGRLTAGLGLDGFYRKWLAAPYARAAAFLWRGVDEDMLNGTVLAATSGISGLSDGIRRLGGGRIAVSLVTVFALAAIILTWLAVGWTQG